MENERSGRRIASWWLRFEDLNWPNADTLDRIKRRAEGMARADVTAAMIFGAHFRWDFLPYFTILNDYLATVSEELRALGIELYDHHSVCLVHRYDTRQEMRRVILHSGPHLPFSPSRNAAASWEYRGKRLNDWRMIDVRDGKPAYYPQYTAESFCTRNPEYREAYKDYIRTLVSETGIRGLSADDPIHFMQYATCACSHCQAELKRRAGITLPPIDDRSFWGNWENPAWRAWIDLRLDGVSDFLREIKGVLPEGFLLTTCGGASATAHVNASCADGRRFLGGCNYLNLEMVGNTPPYRHDPVTSNSSISHKMINAAHHQGAAIEQGLRCFGTGFAFTEATANIVWAVNKMLGADCWMITLKDRLGLPEHILRTLPNEEDIVGRAYGFEKQHPELFDGTAVAQLGVYFSEETKFHTYFGNLDHGYCEDFGAMMKLLFAHGISAHTIFRFPKDASRYPCVLLPSAASMTDAERAALDQYTKNGGTVIACGPSAIPEAEGEWALPTSPDVKEPSAFFCHMPDGPFPINPAWMRETTLTPCEAPISFRECRQSVLYTPHRVSDGKIDRLLMDEIRQCIKPYPVKVVSADGYLVTTFEHSDSVTVHLLAADFDTDIDHKLDEIRFHRSRVNFINRVEPIGVARTVLIDAAADATVYTPFNEATTLVTRVGDQTTVTLPDATSYLIVRFPKNWQ